MKTVKHGIPAFFLALLLALISASITLAQQGQEPENPPAEQAAPEKTGQQGEPPDTETDQPAEPPTEQPEQPTEPPATAAPPEPAIEPPAEAAPAISDIPRRARKTADDLRSLREKASPQPSVLEADRKLPAAVEAVEALQQSTVDSDLETLSIRRLDDLTLEWQRYQSLFQAYSESLGRRASNLEAARRQIQEYQAEWEGIRATADREELPESVLTDAADTATELRERLDTVLVLQNRASEQRTVIAGQLEKLAVAHRIARQRLFAVDSPPLWRAIAAPAGEVSLSGQLEASWRRDSEVVRQFLEDYPQNILAQFLFFLAFAVVLHILNRRGRSRLEADEDLAISAHIMARPFSAALLLVLFTTRLWYPETPSVIVEIVRLLYLVPLISLLPGILEERLRPRLYGLAWLYLLDGARNLTMEESLLERLLLLLVTALVLAGALWMLRPGSAFRAYSRNRWWRMATLLLGVGAFFMVVSLVANLFGNTTLANLLTRGTLNSAYGAVVLAAGSMVVRGLVAVLLHTERLRTFPSVRHYGNLILTRTTTFIRLLALFLWAYFTLVVFDVWQPAVEWASLILGTAWTLGGLSLSLGDILLFVLTIWLAVLASRFIRFILQEDVFPRIQLPRGVAGSASILVNYLILAIGFIIALTAAGIEWSRFALIAGALGVGIGFGLQNIVNNFVSGLVLIFERPIQLGDTIEVGPLLGIVRRIGIRSSTIRTYDGAEVIVPNGDLVSREVVNWTLSDQHRRIEIPVGVAYGTEPARVLEILEEVGRGHEKSLEFPSPRAFFEGFGDSSLNFLLRFWTGKFQDWWAIRSEMTVAINDALKAANITIPFPQRDLHVRSVDRDAGRTLTGRESAETALPDPARRRGRHESGSTAPDEPSPQPKD
jgi:small-conductance mechanosensitive channel